MTDSGEFSGEQYDPTISEQTRHDLVAFVEGVIPAEASCISKHGHLVIGEGVELDIDYSNDNEDSQTKLFIEDRRSDGFPSRSIIELWLDHDEDGKMYLTNTVVMGKTGRDVSLNQVTAEDFSDIAQTIRNSLIVEGTADGLAEVVSLLKGEQIFADDGRILGFPSPAHRQVVPSREQANMLIMQVAALEIPNAQLTYSYTTNVPFDDGLELSIYKEDKTVSDKKISRWGLHLYDSISDAMTNLVVDSTGQAKLITPSNVPLYEFGLNWPDLIAHTNFMEEIGEFEAPELEAQDVLEFMKALYDMHGAQKKS